MNKITLAGLVLCSSFLMTACGGGSDDPVATASSNVTATINPTTGASVVGGVLNQGFVFPAGVGTLGTAVPTTLTLTGTGAAPTFAIKAGADAATGTVTYGSCIFTVTNSTFAAGHRLALGSTANVTPCLLTLETAGRLANGSVESFNARLVLGTSTSNQVSVAASINPTGTVTLNGAQVGQVALVTATGASN